MAYYPEIARQITADYSFYLSGGIFADQSWENSKDRGYAKSLAAESTKVFAWLLQRQFDGALEVAWDERVEGLPAFVQSIFAEELQRTPEGKLVITTDGVTNSVSLSFCDEGAQMVSGVTIVEEPKGFIFWGRDFHIRMDCAPHHFPPSAYSQAENVRRANPAPDDVLNAKKILEFVGSHMNEQFMAVYQ